MYVHVLKLLNKLNFIIGYTSLLSYNIPHNICNKTKTDLNKLKIYLKLLFFFKYIYPKIHISCCAISFCSIFLGYIIDKHE